MTTLQFLAEWALRSTILILTGALLLWALRVKDASIRLAAWTAILCGSLAIPALTTMLPHVPLAWIRLQSPSAAVLPMDAPTAVYQAAGAPLPTASGPRPVAANSGGHTDWTLAALAGYVGVSLALLLRLAIGLAFSVRLLRGSQATGQSTEGIEVRESRRVAAPVTLGIAHRVILLPGDWRQWDRIKLEAVLAHERSHIRRHDPAVQLLSAIHRALLWHSPLSWFLHHRIVRVAEEASDDAALAVTGDRALYAEVLLDFMQRGVRSPNWVGVPMARYGRADDRIHRILDGTSLSRGITRRSLAAILALVSPLAYVVAAAHPQRASQTLPARQPVPGRAEPPAATLPAAPRIAPRIVAQSAPRPRPRPASDYLSGTGNVAATTVIVRPRVDGQLLSVSFKEGEMVQAGQVLAAIDPRPFEIEVAKAQAPLAAEEAELDSVRHDRNMVSDQRFESMVAQMESRIKSDRAAVESAKLQLAYTQIVAPITGVAGLRLVDPGNVVRAADATGILTIVQLQPVSVLFTIPEDELPPVRARLALGATPLVEAWSRGESVKLATGRLAAVDNQIDAATATAKLRAVFDNKDGALFPNQFVNVHLFLNNQGK